MSIEQSIAPFKLAELAEYVSEKKGISVNEALLILYQAEVPAMLLDEKAKWWYYDVATLYEEICARNHKGQLSMSRNEFLFFVFCVELFTRERQLSHLATYALFSDTGLDDYLIRNFDVLHSQGEDFILEDIDTYLQRRGR